MHQRYNFELVENEPDMKVLRTTTDGCHSGNDCWVYFLHDNQDLDMVFRSNVQLKDQFEFADGLWQEITRKIKLCYKIITNQKLEFNSCFSFRGRNHIEDFADMVSLLGKEVKQETNELVETKKQLRKENK